MAEDETQLNRRTLLKNSAGAMTGAGLLATSGSASAESYQLYCKDVSRTLAIHGIDDGWSSYTVESEYSTMYKGEYASDSDTASGQTVSGNVYEGYQDSYTGEVGYDLNLEKIETDGHVLIQVLGGWPHCESCGCLMERYVPSVDIEISGHGSYKIGLFSDLQAKSNVEEETEIGDWYFRNESPGNTYHIGFYEETVEGVDTYQVDYKRYECEEYVDYSEPTYGSNPDNTYTNCEWNTFKTLNRDVAVGEVKGWSDTYRADGEGFPTYLELNGDLTIDVSIN